MALNWVKMFRNILVYNSGEVKARPSNLSITKIINSNVVVMIIVLAWLVSTRKLCSDLRDQAETSTSRHKQFSSVSALPQ